MLSHYQYHHIAVPDGINHISTIYVINLVGALEHVLFFDILGIIIPIDIPIFQRGVAIPPTRNLVFRLKSSNSLDDALALRSSSVLLGISLGYAAAAVGAVARQAAIDHSLMGFE